MVEFKEYRAILKFLILKILFFSRNFPKIFKDYKENIHQIKMHRFTIFMILIIATISIFTLCSAHSLDVDSYESDNIELIFEDFQIESGE